MPEPRPNESEADFGAKPHPYGRSWRIGWLVPPDRADSAFASIQGLGKMINHFRFKHPESGNNAAEVEHRIMNLEREAAALAAHGDRLPGILALVRDKLSELRDLRSQDTEAKQSAWIRVELLEGR